MNVEEYRRLVLEATGNQQRKTELRNAYALEHCPYKLGQILEDYKGNIFVCQQLLVTLPTCGDIPFCKLVGKLRNKDLTPKEHCGWHIVAQACVTKVLGEI